MDKEKPPVLDLISFAIIVGALGAVVLTVVNARFGNSAMVLLNLATFWILTDTARVRMIRRSSGHRDRE